MKYELTNETIKVGGRTLYRIRALKDFNTFTGFVQKGDLGGFVENEFNLSLKGDCWIYDDAMVYDTASVSDNAIICNNVRVYDDAAVSGDSIIKDDVRIFHNARVYDSNCSDSSWIYGNASVYRSRCESHSLIYGDTMVDFSTIGGFARINGFASVANSTVIEYAQITDKASIMTHSIIRDSSIVSDNGVVDGGVAKHNAKVSQSQHITAAGCSTDLTKDLSESIRAQTGLVPFNGQVIAYKQVRKDLTSFHDPCFQYRVGEWAVARNAEESTRGCASGLHFSNAGYWNPYVDVTDSTFLIAQINLEDIITVQQGKIRCRKAFILGTYDIKK